MLLRLTAPLIAIEFGVYVDRPQRQRTLNTRTPRHVKLHRFEETINGRVYKIEVSAVRPDRWRAYLVKLTGGPTALMPFYGRTPDEASELLVSFLTRAHRVASSSASSGIVGCWCDTQ